MTIKKRTLGSLISFINQSKTEYCPEITIGSRGARPSGLLIPRVYTRSVRGGFRGPPQSVKTLFFPLISTTSLLNTHLHYYLTYVDLFSDTTGLIMKYNSRVQIGTVLWTACDVRIFASIELCTIFHNVCVSKHYVISTNWKQTGCDKRYNTCTLKSSGVSGNV